MIPPGRRLQPHMRQPARGRRQRQRPGSRPNGPGLAQVLLQRGGATPLLLLAGVVNAGAVGYRATEGWDWGDCYWMVLITLSTMGFSDPATQVLSGGGRVREYQLRYRMSYRLLDKNAVEILPVSEIALIRDFSFNDSEALSKEAEEALLFRDMQSDAVQQLLRRLQVVKLTPAKS